MIMNWQTKREGALRVKFPLTFALLDELERSSEKSCFSSFELEGTKPFDPRATIQGLGAERWHDRETGITIDWDPS